MKKLIILTIFFTLLNFCAPRATQPASPPEAAEEEVVVVGEEETVTEETPKTEETIIVTEEETQAPKVTETVEEGEVAVAPTPEPKPTPPTPEPKKVFGYRVQIIALDASKPGNKEKANKYAREAEARLRGEHKVYVEYIPPYYKVRVGDFLSKEEADKMKMRLRGLGYFDAWVVETEVSPRR
ncbi:MAG: SPOR domain-containing protein [Candidatus Hydrothermales bacterium]